MLEIILFILTLFASAFFSSSETAFVSANRLKLRLSYREKPNVVLKSDERFLATILVGNNVVMVACSSLAVIVFSPFISETVLVLCTTGFLLVFGEILPKSIASQIPHRLLRFSVHALSFFYFFFYPLIWLAERLSKLLFKVLGHDAENKKLFSRVDLPLLAQEYLSRSDFTMHNQQLLARALKFREKRLWDIMIPRTDIVAVEQNESIDNVQITFQQSGFSRLPVFKGDLDSISGFLYVLDFFENDFKKLPPIRLPLILPESTKIMDALETLKRERTSIAIVVDEHGGTAGLVTVEDIIEKLVGVINDEFDRDRRKVKTTGDAAFIVDGKMSVDELRERFEINIPEGDYVTIAGLVEDQLGRIPKAGEALDMPTCKIKVLEANKTKIIKVWITKKPSIKGRQ